MRKINENRLAKEITRQEGMKESLSIAQVKEVLRITLEVLAEYHSASEIMELVERHM